MRHTDSTAPQAAAGAYLPFTGPINKQGGSVFLTQGEVATDLQLVQVNIHLEVMLGDIHR